jgi:hypothetical protein
MAECIRPGDDLFDTAFLHQQYQAAGAFEA